MVLGCTLSELGRRMSAKEFNVWQAEYEIEPWGEERSDLRAGSIVQAALMPHCKNVKFKDCVLNFEPPKKQTWQDMQKMCMSRTLALGGKVK
jgi:hypothetical protein